MRVAGFCPDPVVPGEGGGVEHRALQVLGFVVQLGADRLSALHAALDGGPEGLLGPLVETKTLAVGDLQSCCMQVRVDAQQQVAAGRFLRFAAQSFAGRDVVIHHLI